MFSERSSQAPAMSTTQLNNQHQKQSNQLEYLKAEVSQLQLKLSEQETELTSLRKSLETLNLEALPSEIGEAYSSIREAITAILVTSSVLTESEV